MRITLLVLLVLSVAACNTYTDPYAQIAAGNAALQMTSSAQRSERAAQVEQARQMEEANMATAGAAQIEIDLMNSQAQATETAIVNEQNQLNLAMSQLDATHQAWEVALIATRTMAPIQATQTVAPTVRAAAMAVASARAERQEAITRLTPLILFTLLCGIIAIVAILVAWLYQRMQKNIELQDALIKNKTRETAVIQVRNGVVLMDRSAQYIDRPPVNIPDLNAQLPAPVQTAPVAPSIQELEIDPELADAIKLLQMSGNSLHLVSYRASGLTWQRWSSAVELLEEYKLAITTNLGTLLVDAADMTLQQLLNLSPTGSVSAN